MTSKKQQLKAQNTKRKTRIGLFGGTFNPIHIGHIKMAKATRKQFKLDTLYFIPAGIPPHKTKKNLMPANKRYKLIVKALKKLNGKAKKQKFGVLDVEIKKKTKCYTIDTIKKIKQQTTDKRQQLFFLVGQDEFEKLHTWEKANELTKLVTFIVLPRSVKSKKGSKSTKLKNLKWHKLKAKPINISSTEIRKKIK